MSERSPALGHCQPCGHVWSMAWLPLPVDAAARLMKGGCPACGERKRIFMAKEVHAALWRAGPRGEPCFVKPEATP